MENVATSVKKRRQKRVKILQALEDLKNALPTIRVRTMNAEFGPGWYYLLVKDGKIPDDLKQTKRYLDWGFTQNPGRPKVRYGR